jgi:hypothetical protein
MRSNPKKNPKFLELAALLLAVGQRLGSWSEGQGLAPRLVSFCLKEKLDYAA